ncbi:hypothetical protein ACFQ1I_07070 [Kitasatospora arboriphila]
MPDLVEEAAARHGLGADAAALYLMLLAMPDPTDRNTARWTGWKPARLKAARAELAATDLVVQASRTRAAGRSSCPAAGRSSAARTCRWRPGSSRCSAAAPPRSACCCLAEPPRSCTDGPGSACSTATCRASAN